jgi:hypothetical protein
MAALPDILDEQARIKTELQRMEDSDETTEENDGDLRDTLVARWEELDKKAAPIIERMERIRSITRMAGDESSLERPDGTISQNAGDGRQDAPYRGGNPDLVTRRFRDPFDANDLIRNEKQILMRRSELRERACDAIEADNKRGNLSHDFAEAATRMAQEQFFGQSNVARHILLTGSDEYQEAFRAYLEDPQGNAQRAALSLTLANGGYLLPYVLDPTILITNTGSANPWRRISNVKQTTSNTWNGVTSAGVSAAWLAEAGVAADATPTVGNVVVTPQKAAAWLFGNFALAA